MEEKDNFIFNQPEYIPFRLFCCQFLFYSICSLLPCPHFC